MWSINLSVKHCDRFASRPDRRRKCSNLFEEFQRNIKATFFQHLTLCGFCQRLKWNTIVELLRLYKRNGFLKQKSSENTKSYAIRIVTMFEIYLKTSVIIISSLKHAKTLKPRKYIRRNTVFIKLSWINKHKRDS